MQSRTFRLAAAVAVAAFAVAAGVGGGETQASFVISNITAKPYADRVILVLDKAIVATDSLAAADEKTLFGIATPPPFVAADEAPATPVIARETPQAVAVKASRGHRHRCSKVDCKKKRLLAGTRKRARSRTDARALAESVASEAPQVMVETGLAPLDLSLPRRAPGASAALMQEAVPEDPRSGIALNDRISLDVGSLSSMAPIRRPRDVTDHDASSSRRDESDDAKLDGAAVGVTFKLN